LNSLIAYVRGTTMKADAQDTDAQHTHFLLRRFVISSWLEVTLSVMYILAAVQMVTRNPVLTMGSIGALCVFSSTIVTPLQLRFGWSVRAYPVWLIGSAVVAAIAALVIAFGFTTH